MRRDWSAPSYAGGCLGLRVSPWRHVHRWARPLDEPMEPPSLTGRRRRPAALAPPCCSDGRTAAVGLRAPLGARSLGARVACVGELAEFAVLREHCGELGAAALAGHAALGGGRRESPGCRGCLAADACAAFDRRRASWCLSWLGPPAEKRLPEALLVVGVEPTKAPGIEPDSQAAQPAKRVHDYCTARSSGARNIERTVRSTCRSRNSPAAPCRTRRDEPRYECESSAGNDE